MDTCVLVFVVALKTCESLDGTDVCHTASGQITFLDCCAGSVESIFHAVFLFLHLNLGSSAHIEHGNAAAQFAKTLLELLLVVLGSAHLDLLADLVHTVADGLLVAGASDYGGVLLGDGHLLGLTEHIGSGVLERKAALLAHHHRSGKGSDILKHLFAAVAKARGLDGSNLKSAAEFVHDKGGKSLAVDIFSHDKQFPALTCDRLEDGEKVLHRADLLVGHEDGRIAQFGLHLVAVGHEVRGDVAAVELHTLNHLDFRIGALGLLDRDNSVTAHLGHSVGNELTNIRIVVGADRTDLLHLGVVAADLLALVLERLDHCRNGFVDTALKIHRVGTCGNVLKTHIDDGLGQDGGGGGTVARLLVGLGSDFLDHLGAHVLKAVFELHFLGHGNAVLGHLWSSELFVYHYITAFRSKGYLDCIGQLVGSALHFGAHISIEFYLFCHNYRIAKMSDCLTIRYFLSSTVTSVPAYFPYSTTSPTLTSMGSSFLPGPAATTVPCWGFSFAVSGM